MLGAPWGSVVVGRSWKVWDAGAERSRGVSCREAVWRSGDREGRERSRAWRCSLGKGLRRVLILVTAAVAWAFVRRASSGGMGAVGSNISVRKSWDERIGRSEDNCLQENFLDSALISRVLRISVYID